MHLLEGDRYKNRCISACNGAVDNGSILYWRQTSQVKNAIRVRRRWPSLWYACKHKCKGLRWSTEPVWKSGCDDAFCRICSPAAGEVDTGGSLGLAVHTAHVNWGGQWETLSQKRNTRRGCLVVIFGLCTHCVCAHASAHAYAHTHTQEIRKQHRTDLRSQGGKWKIK